MRWATYILLIFLCVNCRDPYKVFPRTNGDGLLVVEGIINANGKTTISLSRTTRLASTQIAPETLATLFVESDGDDTTYPLFERTSGVYESEHNELGTGKKYRLRIITKDNREYATNFTTCLTTPEFESITWKKSPDGIQLYAQAQTDNSASPYYKWEYEETWEYHAAYRASIGFKEVPPDSLGNHLVLDWLMPDQSVDYSLFTCYNNAVSTTLNLISTEALGKNVLFFPVTSIKTASIKLSELYSILVKNYALSKEGYEFFSKMKKNTESIGSIFDAQPSDLVGNIVCITDPSELVVGYVEASSITERRTFISNAAVPEWGYDPHCKAFVETDRDFSEYPYPNNPALYNTIAARNLMPTAPAQTFANSILTFYVEQAQCVDCKFSGGLPVKPTFWP